MPPEIQGRFHGQKDGTTQNVLAAISFDLKFTYILAGWEDSAHDSRVLNDALTRPRGFTIPKGIIGRLKVVLACCVIHNHIMGLILVTILWKLQCIKKILEEEN